MSLGPVSGLGDLSIPARFPTAACLLAWWERSWSGSARRFATHRLAFLYALGLDVMEIGDVRRANGSTT